ncbi:TetR/AcrR family transcriptional regulator [Micromonospora zhanjiangensis]|uniref:TetR/AcrR family transcriptional regulator n=1 Tax=Micromonospora zhanjiangensis TaxID=1522057 RepID=A0ABV8KW17_9ACTN
MAEATAGAGTRKLRAARTEAALKEAGLRVFARVGYLNAKITDITTEAGRAAGSFYSHFAGKEELLEALLVDLLAEADETAAGPGHSDDFTDLAAVRWHVAAFWRLFRAHRPVMIALNQAAMVDARFADRLREILTPDVAHLAGHLRHVTAAGGELPGDPLVVASAISALLWQAAYAWQTRGAGDVGRTLPDDEAIDTLARLIHRGVVGAGGFVAGG